MLLALKKIDVVDSVYCLFTVILPKKNTLNFDLLVIMKLVLVNLVLILTQLL